MQPLLPLADLIPIRDGDPDARTMYDRHYSARHYRDGRRPLKLIGPGQYLLLTDPYRTCLIGFRRSNRPIAGQTGIYLTVFRNESPRRASDILRRACRLAFDRWTDETTIFTFINPRRTRAAVPGYSFIRAGFRHIADTRNDLMIFALQRHTLDRLDRKEKP